MEGSGILMFEVRPALAKMYINNSPRPDGIVIEMLKAWDDFGIDRITKIMHEIYNSGEIPADFNSAIFIAIPKNSGENEIELTKRIIRILMNSTHSWIWFAIGKTQES